MSKPLYDFLEAFESPSVVGGIEKKYYSKKNQFKKRLVAENVPQHLFVMEGILNRLGAEREVREL